MKRADRIRPPEGSGGSDVPPGQFVTSKFPILTYGPTPRISLDSWRFRIFGLVETEREFDWRQFMALPQSVVTADFHCVTQWSRLDNTWQGVLARDLLALVTPKPEARFAMAHCYGDYTTNLPLEALTEHNVIFAHTHDGQPLEAAHGGPLRLVVPKLYAWKSAKWVNGLEFMAEDRPGFWESRGYHIRGDPWREERFWSEER